MIARPKRPLFSIQSLVVLCAAVALFSMANRDEDISQWHTYDSFEWGRVRRGFPMAFEEWSVVVVPDRKPADLGKPDVRRFPEYDSHRGTAVGERVWSSDLNLSINRAVALAVSVILALAFERFIFGARRRRSAPTARQLTR